MSGTHHTLDQPVPFLRYKEKDFVLLDRPANGKSEVVTANRILLGFRVDSIENGILGIEKVVAAEVIGATVKIVGSRLGNDSDDAAAGSAELGVIAVPLNLEFLNRIKGGVNKNSAVRSYVNVVGAIH